MLESYCVLPSLSKKRLTFLRAKMSKLLRAKFLLDCFAWLKKSPPPSQRNVAKRDARCWENSAAEDDRNRLRFWSYHVHTSRCWLEGSKEWPFLIFDLIFVICFFFMKKVENEKVASEFYWHSENAKRKFRRAAISEIFNFAVAISKEGILSFKNF
jgi:hypothetical protein